MIPVSNGDAAQLRKPTIDDLSLREVTDDGELVFQLPNGSQERVAIPLELVPRYRRLLAEKRQIR